MNTPLVDFTDRYAAAGFTRMHMPGHKGHGRAGCEPFDITEIDGADRLYSPSGIIRESEENAASLFGAGKTVYSAEGASLCIRAMLYCVSLYAAAAGAKPKIAAGRNAHSSFVTAAALLDIDIDWLYSEEPFSLCRCAVTPAGLEQYFASVREKPAAVYITSPDYLGITADLRGLSEVCAENGALLLCDNAHGAYLRFLPGGKHPLELGADICCDSAHKTLPALTGAAYLHFSKTAPEELADTAESAMALFASTSPSYLILRSLDALNRELSGSLPERIAEAAGRTDSFKRVLAQRGWRTAGDEPLKITVAAKSMGYTGRELSEILAGEGITAEYADPDFLVLMVSADSGVSDFDRLDSAFAGIRGKPAIPTVPPDPGRPECVMSPRGALLSPGEYVPVEKCAGRIAAEPSIVCPPAVSAAVCGEKIDSAVEETLKYYSAEGERVRVVKERFARRAAD